MQKYSWTIKLLACLEIHRTLNARNDTTNKLLPTIFVITYIKQYALIFIKNKNTIFFWFHLFFAWRRIPRARIWGWIRGSVISGRFPHRPAIIVSTYTRHGHTVLASTLTPFGYHNLNKLFHVSSGMFHRDFGSKRHL